MKRILITINAILWLGAWQPVQAQDQHPDLAALYEEIDEAIEQSPKYVEATVKKIEEQKRHYLRAENADDKLQQGMDLFRMYLSFKNDSALKYVQQCINLADSLGRKDIAGQARSLMARQCSNAGMYTEAFDLLSNVKKDKLTHQGLVDYYNAQMHVCGEIAAYTLIDELRERFYYQQSLYRDSLQQVAIPGTDDYYHLQLSALVSAQHFQEAKKMSDQWMSKVNVGTREDALASYYRHVVYDKLGDMEQVRFWLGRSALADIRNAVMDQASLITLAQLVNSDGDQERSYRYIRFTWECNSFFNTRMRASQISPVLNVIERNYKASMERNTLIVTIAAVVFVILSIVLLVLSIKMWHQKKELALAKEELFDINEELVTANDKLKKMNERVTKYNRQLFDMNYEFRKEHENLKNDSQL